MRKPEPVRTRDQKKRPSTSSPSSSSRRAKNTATATGRSLITLLMLAWIATWIVGIWLERLPPGLLAAAVAINLATYFVYASDKRAAEKGTWRVSERALHLLSLACGWPAAWFAQQTLRHKSSKHEFRVMYWATVIANTALLAVYVWMPEWGMR